MAKKRTPEQRLAEAIQEMGMDKAEAAFRLLKSYTTKPEPKPRKKKDEAQKALGVGQS